MLQNLFRPSHLDDLDLPDLHKALMGLSGRTFDEAVDLTGRSAINAVDASRRTALSWAAQRGDEYETSRLLMCGADPNIADSNGMTPLHWGASAGEAQCVQVLLLAKADIKAQDRKGFTALYHAATAGSDYAPVPGGAETIYILLASGADVPGLDINGISAFDVATWSIALKAFQFLLDHHIELETALQEYRWGSRRALKDDRYNILPRSTMFPWQSLRRGFHAVNYRPYWADILSVGMLLSQSKSLPTSLSVVDIDSLLRYDRWRWEITCEAQKYLAENPDTLDKALQGFESRTAIRRKPATPMISKPRRSDDMAAETHGKRSKRDCLKEE